MRRESQVTVNISFEWSAAAAAAAAAADAAAADAAAAAAARPCDAVLPGRDWTMACA